nr:hypothetical protein [Rhodococcus sp. (in: high G+C Gram-positive bacteria)]
MTNPIEPMTTWNALAFAAENGQLFLSADVAAQCDQTCASYIANLRSRQDDARVLADVNGWGEFESGKALRKIFAEKAVGGENNMVDVLQSHIDVVEQMRTVFRKFFVDTTATDDGNASAFGGPK